MVRVENVIVFKEHYLSDATHPSTITTERLLDIFFSLELIRKSKSTIVKRFEG